MPRPTKKTLLAVLSNPPVTDGKRTLARLQTVSGILGFENVEVANLFSLPSYRTGEISQLGVTEVGWLAARAAISQGLTRADGVLLAYGLGLPVGAARERFRDQVAWLTEQLGERALPVWQVGDGARHPSRWQRWTCRTHPDLAFPDALQRSLVVVVPAGSAASLRFEHGRDASRLPVDPVLAG